MDHLALFNGIGGFQLAAHWAGWDNIAHVEIDAWCNSKVAMLFPGSKCFTDIKKFNGKGYTGEIDIISGGDPCQPHSVAGLGEGTKDNRYLWPEMWRVIREVRPTWIVNENVSGTLTNGVLDIKIDDLESEGYACQAYCIPAESVGALHIRERVWLVAYCPNNIIKNRVIKSLYSKEEEKRIQKRNEIQRPCVPVDLWSDSSNATIERRKKVNASTESIIRKETQGLSKFFGFGPDAIGNIPRHVIESSIIRMLNGLPKGLDYTERNKRIKALGNAIVPQVALEIFKCINEINDAGNKARRV